MMKKIKSHLALLLSLVALIVAVYTLYQSSIIRKIALTHIDVQERNSLLTPFFDQESGKNGFLAIYEIAVDNHGATTIALESVDQLSDVSEFVIPLKGEAVVDQSISAKWFLVDAKISDIQSDPRLLKNAIKDMDKSMPVAMEIKPGQTKTIRVGLVLDAYDKDKKALADVMLVSFQLVFDHGRAYYFRRGVPIPPITY